MRKRQTSILCLIIVLGYLLPLHAQTIEEKLEMLESSRVEGGQEYSSARVNKLLSQERSKLRDMYAQVDQLIEGQANESTFSILLEDINEVRRKISDLEERWRSHQSEEMMTESETYGIWEQDEMTVSQLIMEYGSQDYLYVIPAELGAMKLSVHSSLMIPRESWSALLEAVFQSHGIGMRRVNAYTKVLYLVKQEHLSVTHIVSEKTHLHALDPMTRVLFVYSPPVEVLKQAFYLVERFRDPKTSFVYQAGTKIVMVGFQSEIKKLITLCTSVWEESESKITRVVPTLKIQPDQVIKILKAYFGGLAEPNRSIVSMKGGNDLTVFPLAAENGVVLIGTRQTVERAERIIQDTEQQVDDPSELTIFWYTCSHCNPVDLCEVLEKVYSSLIFAAADGGDSDTMGLEAALQPRFPGNTPPPQGPDGEPGSPQASRPWPNGMMEKEDAASDKTSKERPATFIPNPTTGTVLMVTRKDLLGKIKEVIKRYDIPKRMVEIEVLLCERRLTQSGRAGINLLKMGEAASNLATSSLVYDATSQRGRGLLEFILRHKSDSSFPAFDLTYQFLLSQEDVRVTASPSVVTINQVPATIAITDQISISNGAAPVDTNGGIIFKESFERADFGITITLTPTVHEPGIDEGEDEIYVTLENDISFETIKAEIASRDKPDVHKRSVKNMVRIPNGQTVILGGLKYKSSEDNNEKIPFLGDIPGIGKLFGTTATKDQSNEMFIFIRPKVIEDPKRDLLRIREEKLRFRPGDTDYLLQKICESRKRKDISRFKETFELMFGSRTDETCEL